MKKEEIVKAIKEAYDKGYHEGFKDACDLVPTYLTEFIGNLISTLKESVEEAKCEVFDMEDDDDMPTNAEINDLTDIGYGG